MKKRVFSILLALALCFTLLPAAAWAGETGAGGTHCTHENRAYRVKDKGTSCEEYCKDCNTILGSYQHYADDDNTHICKFCQSNLVAYFKNKSGITTWEKVFNVEKGDTREVYAYEDANIAEALTLNVKGAALTIHPDGVSITGDMAVKNGSLTLKFDSKRTGDSSTVSNINVDGGTMTIDATYSTTINNLTVNGGTLNVTGNDLLTINTLTVNGGTVKLSGGTYKEIEGANINDLLERGYYAVRTTDGKTSVQKAPITSVTVSVANNDNTVYGYTADQAPVLTANVTLRDGVTEAQVTYQWYEDAVEETPIPKATGKIYTLPTDLDATGDGSIGYYCKATVGGCTVTSNNIAYVTIQKAPALQLPDVNVKQVFSDTTTQTINLYDYIAAQLNDLEKEANKARKTDNPIGKMQFKDADCKTPNSISSSSSGRGLSAETGVYTYAIKEGLTKGHKITVTYKVGFTKDTGEESKTDDTYAMNHEDAEGRIIITLTGIVPTGTPNYTPVTTEGKTLADVQLNADNDAFSVPGKVEWVLEDNQTPRDVTVVKGQAYKWEFTPDDDNIATYEGLTGTIIPWTENGSGTVIIITPPEQTTDNTTNPATGAAAQPALGLALLAMAAICVDKKLRRQ